VVIIVTTALIIFFGAWAVAADAEGRELTFGIAETTAEDQGSFNSEGGDQARAAFGTAPIGAAPIGETSGDATVAWWGKGFLKACPLH
jgi:hypothetical protein